MTYESPTIEMLGDEQMASIAGEGKLIVFYIFVAVLLAFVIIAAEGELHMRKWFRRRFWF